jgi:hypothetical protein
MANEKKNGAKLIWCGNPKCRSLVTRTSSGLRFYLDGDEIPDGTLAPALEATMIADGRIKVISPTVAVPLPTLSETNPSKPVQVVVVHGEQHPLSIASMSEALEFETLVTPLEPEPLTHEQPETEPKATQLEIEQASSTSHPHSIAVQVGVMEATVEDGADGKLGTADDIVNIRPVHNSAVDAKPDTAPVRARQSKGAAERTRAAERTSDDDGRHKRKKGKR